MDPTSELSLKSHHLYKSHPRCVVKGLMLLLLLVIFTSSHVAVVVIILALRNHYHHDVYIAPSYHAAEFLKLTNRMLAVPL